MKKRVKHIAVAQCGKMLAAIYFAISLPIVLILLVPTLLGMGQAPFGAGPGVGFFIIFPFIYALFMYLGGVLSAWIYNIVASRLGGFEYTTSDLAP